MGNRTWHQILKSLVQPTPFSLTQPLSSFPQMVFWEPGKKQSMDIFIYKSEISMPG